MGAHLLQMRRLYDEGKLLFGGPYKTVFGGIAVLEAASYDEAKEIMDADAAVRAGIMAAEVLDVRPYFDAFAGKAWSPGQHA